MASSISKAKILLMLTIVVVCFKNDVHGTTQSPSSSPSKSDVKSDPNSKPAASPFSSSSSSPSSSSSDLYTEYILRDLLRSATKSRRPAPKHNANPNNRPVADAWISAQRPPSSNRYSDVDQADDMNDESQPLMEDQDDQQKLFNYALWLLQQQQRQQQQQQPSAPQAETEYDVDDRWENYGLPQLKQPAPIQSTMQDLSWFDGPVSPKVSPMMMDFDDDNNNGNYRNNMMVDTNDNNDDETENPNLDAESEALLNSLWIKYLTNINNNDDTNDGDDDSGEINENIENQDTMIPDVDYSDLDRLIGLNQMIDKRRQKVIKHEDIPRNVEPTTTQKPSTTTMANSQENHRQRQPILSLNEKAKFLHKATMFNQNDNNNGNHQHSFRKQPTYHPIKIGQKEYPMLRPALDSNTKSNQDPNNGGGDWPSELDENTMAEEESLKQLPKQQQQQQQQIARRQIRDVLASQLDSLKQQDKDSDVGSSSNNNNNNNKTQQQ